MRLKIDTLFFVVSLVESTSSDLCDDGVAGADEDLPENCKSPETWKSCPQWHCTSKFPKQNQTTDLLYIKPQGNVFHSLLKTDNIFVSIFQKF